jgi:hypothetical protein
MFNWRDPFHVWVWGLSYCQSHLTDGAIVAAALPKAARRAADELVERGLWEAMVDGWKVHDYLDWNDSRALVTDRRTKAKTRFETWKQQHSNGVATALATQTQRDSNLSKPNLTKKKEPSLPKEPADGRVREFLDWFPAEYKTRRHGADYLVKWQRDGPLVKQMLGATDLPRLKKLAQILLSDKTDEPFIADTDRGVQILSVKFNWLSERLAAWEARQAS